MQAPELEVHGLDGEAILLVHLAGQLQAEVRLAPRTLTAHLGRRLDRHVGHVQHVPQQAALRMLPAHHLASHILSHICSDSALDVPPEFVCDSVLCLTLFWMCL